jgi:hypothetical protein
MLFDSHVEFVRYAMQYGGTRALVGEGGVERVEQGVGEGGQTQTIVHDGSGCSQACHVGGGEELEEEGVPPEPAQVVECTQRCEAGVGEASSEPREQERQGESGTPPPRGRALCRVKRPRRDKGGDSGSEEGSRKRGCGTGPIQSGSRGGSGHGQAPKKGREVNNGVRYENTRVLTRGELRRRESVVQRRSSRLRSVPRERDEDGDGSVT